MSFSKKVLAGLGLGVLVGLFIGDYAAILKWPAEAFVRLLQTTVFPYILISIIHNLGRLEPPRVRQLAVRVGVVIAGLWLIALIFAFLIPLSFPHADNASFFSTTLLKELDSFDFLGLYVPSNPFNALANSVVPAIVVFSILMGVALMTIEKKAGILDVLAVTEAAIAKATRAIMRLTPYGLFAISANAAGTLNIEQFGHIQIYLIAYTAVGAFVGLWIIPGLVSAFTTISPRELLWRNHDAIITATMAGDVFIVLPSLIDGSKDLLSRHDPDKRLPDLPEVIVPTAYNLPHSGKLLSLSFILFAAWYSDSPIRTMQLPRLAGTGILTFFGSINVAVPFLLDVFRIPADTFQLFVALSVVNSRVGSFVAAVHTLAVAILGSAAMVGHLQWHPRRLIRFGIVSLIATIVLIGGLRVLFSTVLARPYVKDETIMNMSLLSPSVPTVVHKETEALVPSNTGLEEPVLDAIKRRGRLRVGYVPDAMPFAFENAKGQFVGHDVDLAQILARELGVDLEFVPIRRTSFVEQVDEGDVDLVMSGIPITTDVARDILFSQSYLDETLAFIVPDPARHDFETWDSIRQIDPLTIESLDLAYFIDKLTMLLPNAQVHRVENISDLFTSREMGGHAALLTAERGSIWTLLHPDLSVVVPQPNPIRVPLAFPVARHDTAFAAFINSWIDLKKQDGTIDRLYHHWILGVDTTVARPRWSILRNVLHWVR